MSITNKLEAKLEEFKSLQLACKYLDKLNKDIQTNESILKQLHVRLDKEFADIEKLESMTFRAIFESILINKEKQIEKERQEYLKAFLQYREQKKSLELLHFEKKIIEKKVNNYDKAQDELDELIKQREHSLIQEDPVANQVISVINKRLNDCISLKSELHEVIIIGVKANLEIEKTLEGLNQVISWGEFVMNKSDFQYGNELFINKASHHASNVKLILEHLEYELIDVYGDQNTTIQSNLENFNLFIDSFIKNLIVDWVSSRKIKEATYPFHQINLQVKNIVKTLKQDLDALERKQETLVDEKEKLIQALN